MFLHMILPVLGGTATLGSALFAAMRARSRHVRGVMLRWGLPRAPRRGFASSREVSSRLGKRAAQRGVAIPAARDRDPAARSQ
jgi:hypothetical protein